MKISPKQYARALYDLTDGKSRLEIEKSVADFVRYIYRNRKMRLVPKIIEHFGNVYNQKKGIVEAKAVSWKKLEEGETRKIKRYVKEKYKTKELILENVVDESIKGGVVIKVGDEVIDGSIVGRLGELKKILTIN